MAFNSLFQQNLEMLPYKINLIGEKTKQIPFFSPTWFKVNWIQSFIFKLMGHFLMFNPVLHYLWKFRSENKRKRIVFKKMINHVHIPFIIFFKNSLWIKSWKEFCNKTALYCIDRQWIVDLRVLHGLCEVAYYYGTLPKILINSIKVKKTKQQQHFLTRNLDLHTV